MRAVAHVIVNRVGERFGEDVESVIRAPWQFSAWNRGDPNRPLAQNPERYATDGVNLETWVIAQRVAREVLSGQSVDPTEGALFYHTRAISPWWARYGEGRREIGAHVFYRDVPNQRGGPRVVNVNAPYDPPLAIEQPVEAAPAAEAPVTVAPAATVS
jgi:spore germination cell wall hydrolase CwlJ-like protein